MSDWTSDPAEVGRFGELFRRFLDAVVHAAPRTPEGAESLAERLEAHLGVPPAGLPVVTERFAPYDHAHNARIDEQRYNQRSMTETVNSAVKRSLGFAVRARSWFREFREIALMCVVYNIKRAVKQ